MAPNGALLVEQRRAAPQDVPHGHPKPGNERFGVNRVTRASDVFVVACASGEGWFSRSIRIGRRTPKNGSAYA